jgi:hypothetical protein
MPPPTVSAATPSECRGAAFVQQDQNATTRRANRWLMAIAPLFTLTLVASTSSVC